MEPDELGEFLQGQAGVRWEPNWRDTPHIEDGNLAEGWRHIEARHITGTHPDGPGDLFPAGTTRADVLAAATEVVEGAYARPARDGGFRRSRVASRSGVDRCGCVCSSTRSAAA